MSSGGGYSGGMGGYGGGFGQPPMFGGGFGGGFGQPPQYGGGFGSPYGGFGGGFGQPQQFGGGFGQPQQSPFGGGSQGPMLQAQGPNTFGNAYAQRFQKPSVGMFPPTSPQPNQPPPVGESTMALVPATRNGVRGHYTDGSMRNFVPDTPFGGGDIQYAGGSPGFYEAQLQAQQRQGGQGYGNPFGGGFGGGYDQGYGNPFGGFGGGFNPYMASSLIAGLGGMFGGYQAMPFGGFRPNEPFDFSGQQNPQQNAPTAAQQNTSYTPSADKQREDEILQRSYTNPSSITPEDRAFLTQQDEKAAAERGARFGLSPEQNKIREAGLANAGVQRMMLPESSPYLRTPFSLFDPRANSQFNSFDPQSQLNMQAKIAASNQRYIEVDDPSPTGQHGAGLKKYVLAPQ